MVHLNSDEDSIRWKPTTDGHFSCSSAYKLFFVAMELCPVSELIWQAKTPARVRFFTWLAVKGRCLPGDNLAKRGWPHDDNCVLCDREPEDCYHLFVSCDYTSEMWRLMRQWTSISFPTPGIEGLQPTDWWIQARLCFRKSYRSNFDSAFMLMCWQIWKERNARVFEQRTRRPDQLVEAIKEEIMVWKEA